MRLAGEVTFLMASSIFSMALPRFVDGVLLVGHLGADVQERFANGIADGEGGNRAVEEIKRR